MSVLDNLPRSSAPERSNDPLPDAELLFKEARRRRQRRWLLGSAVALLAAALCVGLVITGGIGGGAGPTRRSDQPRSSPGNPFLYGSSGSFAPVGTGVLANAFECASETTCYAVVEPQPVGLIKNYNNSVSVVLIYK